MNTLRTRLHPVSALHSVPLTPPWTVDEFVLWLSRERGMSVSIRPRIPDTTDIVRCGTLYALKNELVITYSPQYSLRHQRQQIFHEIAHVLLDHRGSTSLEVRESALTLGIDPAQVREVLQRSSFSTATEADAELLGTELAIRSRGGITDDHDGYLHRSAAIIESPHR